MTDGLENTVKVLERVAGGKSKKEINDLKALFTDRGDSVSVGAMKEIREAGSVETYLKNQGFTEKDATDMGFESWNDFVTSMESNVETAERAFAETEQKLTSIGMTI